jgi:SAM-dependent methyltransferase
MISRDDSEFDRLLAESELAPVEGWDFSWLAGRATEERPPWGYSRMLVHRIAGAEAVLDVQTGGGELIAEVLDQLPRRSRLIAATEAWPPNVERAASTLRPLGAVHVAASEHLALPFRSATFDLVVSRHPIVTQWGEVARVLRPGGTYFSQQVGAGSMRELTDFMMGPQPVGPERRPECAAEAAKSCGLVVEDLRRAVLQASFNDVGAVAYFLRKVPWTVPDFSVDRYRERLRAIYEHIKTSGPFIAHAQRFLIEARKPVF